MLVQTLSEGDDYSDNSTPFAIGDLDPTQGYVHVFDDASLHLVMGMLDTITDFVAYLTKKEAFIRSGRFGFAAGEEDLMAFYLKYMSTRDEHDFVLPPGPGIIGIEEGHYANFLSRPERRAQVEANLVSYKWDGLLEEFIGHTLHQTHQFTTAVTMSDHERMYRFMAREGRTRRRMLARALIGVMELATSEERKARLVKPSYPGDPYYVFLAMPARPDRTQEEYREVRRELLMRYTMAVKVKFPDTNDIVGIATEPMSVTGRSEDMIYLDGRDWPEERWEEAIHWQKKLRLFEEMVQYVGKEQEYPTSEKNWRVQHVRPPEAKNRRNRPCYCGSGKKYKKCCGAS